METRTHFQSRRLSLIDVSSEDDSLIASSSGNPLASNYSGLGIFTVGLAGDKMSPIKCNEQADQENVELLSSITGNKLEDTANSYEYRERGCQPTKYFEISSTKTTNKYNLRQSFAWDSEFFTSAGVLEPEELSSIMESGDKSEKRGFKLTRMPEDVQRSRDSLSTLNDSLESLEADLFEDIRASIQKSHNKVPKEKQSSKRLPEASQSRFGRASKKLDMADHNKMKLKSASKNSSNILQVSGRTTKQPCSPQLSKRSVAKSTELSLCDLHIKSEKSGPCSISSKRDSLGDLNIKPGKDNSRRIAAGGSQISMPKRAVLRKSSLGSSAATKTRSSTSSSLAGKIGKPDNNSWKRKNDSASNIPHSSSSIVKTQLRFASRNKMQSEKSNLSACLKSVSELSSCSSVAQKSATSSTYLDNESSQKASSDAKAPKFSDSQNLAIKESMEGERKQVTDYSCQSVNNASTGLRLPSAKIGFFDGAKHLTRTPRGPLQSHAVIPGGLRKTGGRSNSSNSQQKKEKVAKPHPAGSVMAVKATGGNPQPSGAAKRKSPTRSAAKAVAKTSLYSEDLTRGETSMDIQNSSSPGTVAAASNSEGIMEVRHNNNKLDPDSAKGKDVIDPSAHKIHSKDKEGAHNGEGSDSPKPESTSSICMTTESTSPGNGLLIDQPELLSGTNDQQNYYQKPIDRLKGRFEALTDKSSPGGLIDQNRQSLSKMALKDHADAQSSIELLCPRKDNS